MKDFKQRIGSISEEKRALLEQLLKRKGLQLPGDEAVRQDRQCESAMSEVLKRVAAQQSGPAAHVPRSTDKELIRQTYNAYHTQLQSAIFHEHSFFMNIGYVANDAPQHSKIALPERMVSKNYIKLALEVIGDCDLAGRRVLDVGCGRGGTVHVIQKYFRPLEVAGVDLTTGAIEFCNAHHRYPNTRFLLGDAEDLPFADGSFDVVTNIESSHHYEQIEKFYRGVYRVLSAGGHFLYATMLPAARFSRDVNLIEKIGFVLERNQDITRNVLAACDQDKVGVFGGMISADQHAWIADQVSLPGSATYNNMESGKAWYRMFKLRKPA